MNWKPLLIGVAVIGVFLIYRIVARRNDETAAKTAVNQKRSEGLGLSTSASIAAATILPGGLPALVAVWLYKKVKDK